MLITLTKEEMIKEILKIDLTKYNKSIARRYTMEANNIFSLIKSVSKNAKNIEDLSKLSEKDISTIFNLALQYNTFISQSVMDNIAPTNLN